MRVVLSIDPIRFPLTGIGRYTYELARHLPQVAPELDLRFMAGGRFVDHLPTESASSDPTRGLTLAMRLRRWAQNNSTVAVAGRRAWVSFRETQSLKGHEDSIFHGPQFYLPRFAGRSVVTIHDLSVFSWAHCHPPGRVRVMQQEVMKSISRASMILTDSEFTRKEVAEFFSLPGEKVRAVSLASADSFRPRTSEDLSPVLARLGLPGDGYCLYSGTIEPRKNLGMLLNAYSMLSEPMRKAWPLVLCGYQGWRSDELHAQIRRAENEGWAHYLGYVSNADLPYVFAGARLFAFPSFYEGFGLPVLEAMASGVPVLCSNSSSLPEVAGNAALMCNPNDIDCFLDLLKRGLQDEVWRAEARANGLKRAARFNWQYCAAHTYAVYKAVQDH